MTLFCHSGLLEDFHSAMLKYCPKRNHFSYRGMIARMQQAALDKNFNVNRKQAKTTRVEFIFNSACSK